MKRNKLPPTISLEFLLNEVKEQKEVFEKKFHKKNIEEKKFYIEKYNSTISSSTNTTTSSNN